MTQINKYRLRYIFGDVIAVGVAVFLFNVVRYYSEPVTLAWGGLTHFLFSGHNLLINFAVILFWIALFTLSGYYNQPINKSRIDEFWTSLWSISLGSIVAFLLWVVDDKILSPFSHLHLLFILWGIVFLLVYGLRLTFTQHSIRQRNDKRRWRRVIAIGTPEGICRLTQHSEQLRITIVDIIEVTNKHTSNSAVVNLGALIRGSFYKNQPEALFISSPHSEQSPIGHLLYQLYPLGCSIFLDVESLPQAQPRPRLSNSLLWGLPMIEVTETNMSEFAKNVKWCFDRLASLVALILLAPLFLVLSVVVHKSSKGPIFFKQQRIGKHGKPFYIYKFRTMFVGAETAEPKLSFDGDPRITPAGRWMRRYRLDELPQLYNVLKGDMSFVGPRPERQYYINQLVEYAPYYYLLHNVLPGITSWGMVRYGYASTIEEMVERSRFDWLYYENMSLRLDATILIYTVGTVLRAKGK